MSGRGNLALAFAKSLLGYSFPPAELEKLQSHHIREENERKGNVEIN